MNTQLAETKATTNHLGLYALKALRGILLVLGILTTIFAIFIAVNFFVRNNHHCDPFWASAVCTAENDPQIQGAPVGVAQALLFTVALGAAWYFLGKVIRRKS